MLAGDAYSSGHQLVLSYLGLSCVVLVETNPYAKLVVVSRLCFRFPNGAGSTIQLERIDLSASMHSIKFDGKEKIFWQNKALIHKKKY